ncbi:MAG: ABC transporter permease [archaeon]|nr:ABC transporter permease [archaeon]
MSKGGKSSLFKELRKSKSGLAGLIILAILFVLTIYSLVTISPQVGYNWQNGDYWASNPVNAPPSWITVFGAKVVPSLQTSVTSWSNQSSSGGGYSLYFYSGTTSFTWSSNFYPQNIVFIPTFKGQVQQATINWTKPDGESIILSLSEVSSGETINAQNPSFVSAASNYLTTQTGQFYGSLSQAQVIKVFFGKSGTGIINSSSSPLEGRYTVSIDVESSSSFAISSSVIGIVGTSYGLMGTDHFGRPIQLGIIAGLPNALEIGFLVAIVSVIVGILYGGISGFIGGRKDSFLQFGTLVILALPALPFLIVMSYTTKLSIIVEVLFIAAISWPFYAIIARAVALSIKSQTFVEADKAMGVSQFRVFFSHFMPRLVPVTVAYTVLGIPGGILLAQALSFLGIQPPFIITWGEILNSAFRNQAAALGFWWWVVFPGLMIIISAVPFVLIGFALERIIAPRVAAK